MMKLILRFLVLQTTKNLLKEACHFLRLQFLMDKKFGLRVSQGLEVNLSGSLVKEL